MDPAIRYYLQCQDARRDPLNLFYLGELYREHKKDYKQALRFLQESWDLEPGSPSVRSAAESCAKELGRPELQWET